MVVTIRKHKALLSKIGFATIGFLSSVAAFADSTGGDSGFSSWINSLGIGDMMEHFSHNYVAIRMCITGFAFLTGCILIVKAVHQLRAYGQVRTMMPSHAEFTGPMLQFGLGIVLMALPTLIHISIVSFWGYSNPLTAGEAGVGLGSEISTSVGGLIQILGLIALVRGLIIMARSANKGAPPGQFGKGFAHLIGGVCAVNYFGLIATLKSSFGL